MFLQQFREVDRIDGKGVSGGGHRVRSHVEILIVGAVLCFADPVRDRSGSLEKPTSLRP